jgi:hypothetical protein
MESKGRGHTQRGGVINNSITASNPTSVRSHCIMLLKSPWVMVDCVVFCILSLWIALLIYGDVKACSLDISLESEDYINLQTIGYFTIYERCCASVLLVVCWCRLLQYLSIIPAIGPLARVMGKMIKDVMAFITIFCCYLIGAAVAFTIIFGNELYCFRDTSHSVVALVKLMFGDGEYERMEQINPLLAPVMYTGHLFIAGILFINLLIAMLNKRYEISLLEAAKEWRRDIVYGAGAGKENGRTEPEEEDQEEQMKSVNGKISNILSMLSELQSDVRKKVE